MPIQGPNSVLLPFADDVRDRETLPTPHIYSE